MREGFAGRVQRVRIVRRVDWEVVKYTSFHRNDPMVLWLEGSCWSTVSWMEKRRETCIKYRWYRLVLRDLPPARKDIHTFYVSLTHALFYASNAQIIVQHGAEAYCCCRNTRFKQFTVWQKVNPTFQRLPRFVSLSVGLLLSVGQKTCRGNC